MDYTQITEEQAASMLAAIGVRRVDDLFDGIPERFRGARLDMPDGIGEPALLDELTSLARRNAPCVGDGLVCFLGAGAYDHFSPTVVDYLASRSEFLTAYTPYQAEASQGALQAFFEFQTMIARLTGMESANASLYDAASAAAEAVTMAVSLTGRRRVVVSRTVHPDTIAVLRTLTYEQQIDLEFVDGCDGRTDTASLSGRVDERTAAVLVQSPNFFGLIESVPELVKAAHDVGALAIVSVCPVSCGVLKNPGSFGADVVVGEGQSLGIPVSYGGPYLGFFACRGSYLRKMPGRIVGMTRDADGRRAFCLTLQTREQHIRREKATSNICTNQGLLALRAAVHLAALGRRGLATVARRCVDGAHYAAGRIGAIDGFSLRFAGPFFKEFVVRSERAAVSEVLDHCRSRSLLAGVALGRWFPELSDCFMVAVTERRTRPQIDALVEALETV